MQTIEIHDIVPDPIAEVASKTSEVWFKDHSFTRGKHYLISAESGTGKSSFFDFLYGRRHDYQGSITFDGASLHSFKVRDWNKIRQHNISLVFQGFRLFPELTVWENLQLKNHQTGYLSDQKMMQMLETLGIPEKRDIPLRFISYGQQQRVALIRAMALIVQLTMLCRVPRHPEWIAAMLCVAGSKSKTGTQSAVVAEMQMPGVRQIRASKPFNAASCSLSSIVSNDSSTTFIAVPCGLFRRSAVTHLRDNP